MGYCGGCAWLRVAAEMENQIGCFPLVCVKFVPAINTMESGILSPDFFYLGMLFDLIHYF
jgi:hypothetical protein